MREEIHLEIEKMIMSHDGFLIFFLNLRIAIRSHGSVMYSSVTREYLKNLKKDIKIKLGNKIYNYKIIFIINLNFKKLKKFLNIPIV